MAVNKFKLIDIIYKISAITSLPAIYLLNNIDFWGGNEHLALPVLEAHYIDTNRHDNVLTGDEYIEGKYLLFSYCGHDGTSALISHDSLEELEASILSPGGIINTFTSYCIPFIGGKPKNYAIKTVDENGDLIYFDKHKNGDLFWDSEHRSIEWANLKPNER